MAKTNTGLIAYAKAQLGKPYWYGTFGQTGTASLLESKARQYPSFYTSARLANARKQYGERVHDCVGLIKGYLWSENNTAAPKYNAAQDVSANKMRSLCKESGKMNTLPEIAGVLVFMDGHVGIYEGNGNVIECTVNYGGGVVRTKLSQRKWTSWGKCPYITYEAEKKPTTTEKPATKPAASSQSTANSFLPARGYFKQGDKGENVRKINDFFYNVFPSYAKTLKRNKENLKGDLFGVNSVAWTKEFQKRTGLEADGYIGKLTLAEMKKHGFKE